MKEKNKLSFAKKSKLLKKAFKKWWDRDPFNESAVIAYNAIFSLPGLLVIVLTIAGYFWGKDAVSGRLHREVSEAMGTDTADQIQMHFYYSFPLCCLLYYQR